MARGRRSARNAAFAMASSPFLPIGLYTIDRAATLELGRETAPAIAKEPGSPIWLPCRLSAVISAPAGVSSKEASTLAPVSPMRCLSSHRPVMTAPEAPFWTHHRIARHNQHPISLDTKQNIPPGACGVIRS